MNRMLKMSIVDSVFSNKKFPPTPEQKTLVSRILEAYINTCEGKKSTRQIIVASSTAGSGKSTTVLDAASALHKYGINQSKSIKVLAFSKAAAKNLQDAGLSWKEVSTINGLGHSVINYFSKGQNLTINFDGNKVIKLLKKTNEELSKLSYARKFTKSLVDFAKYECLFGSGLHGASLKAAAAHYGIFVDATKEQVQSSGFHTLEEIENSCVNWAIDVLNENNKIPSSGEWTIDFNDQVYLPTVLGLRAWKNSLIIVDEAQDLSTADKKLIDRCLTCDGVLVLVGDDCQAIYCWRGCRPNGLANSAKRDGVVESPLTVNWRSGENILKLAREFDPEIKCGRGTNGTINYMEAEDFEILNIDQNSALLSRVRAPLIGHAITLLKNNIPFSYASINLDDILSLIDDVSDNKNDLQLRSFDKRLEKYIEAKTKFYLDLDAEMDIEKLEDSVSILNAIKSELSMTSLVSDLIDNVKKIESEIKKSSGGLTLSTIHGSKGLEWKNVFLLGYDSIGINAKRDWQIEESKNLKFVALTRAMDELTFIKE